MPILNRILAAAAACLGLNVSAGQFSDMWWNPHESGWGVNVVPQLETAFVTLFVYGPDGKPTWYVAPETRAIAYGPGALPVFSGRLYRTQGPWHGGAFDPQQVAVTEVGTLSLEALAVDRMRIEYAAEGVSVSKQVVRQTWDTPLLGGNYGGTFNLRHALPGQSPPLGTLQYTGDVLVHIEDGNAFLRVDDHLGRRCEYRGAHQQTGKLARMAGIFSCEPGSSGLQSSTGTFEVSDFEVTAHGITGYLRTFAPQLNEYGRFAAVQW